MTVRAEDHPGGDVFVTFASPDGERWKPYAYWTTWQSPVRYLVQWNDDGPEVIGVATSI